MRHESQYVVDDVNDLSESPKRVGKMPKSCKSCAFVDENGNLRVFATRTAGAAFVAPGTHKLAAIKKISDCCRGRTESAFGRKWFDIDPDLVPRGAEQRICVKRRYGNLTVIGKYQFPATDGETLYVCRCDCGTVRVYKGSALLSGEVDNCGCVDSANLVDAAFSAHASAHAELKKAIFGRRTEESGVDIDKLFKF